jgi:hypothetical protein
VQYCSQMLHIYHTYHILAYHVQYCSQMLHIYHTYHILASGSEMNTCCTKLDIILKWSGFKLQMWTQNAETSITTAFQRPEEKQAEQAKMIISPCSSRGQRQGARPSRDTSHGLHPQGESLFVTPDGDYMDRILGCGPAGLRRGRGPLRKC